ncbi:hypothetical protein [Fictibacillus gelatini]|uniref:hypothetical protein n=1 Tax=Fictibacillus gelatini TaxID=225985 RepID=UPI0003FA2460|nr:hypothetical protein [Fictibacillus gelatini]
MQLALRRTKTINFRDFMSGEYKEKKKKNIKGMALAAGSALIPLAMFEKTMTSYASDPTTAITVAAQQAGVFDKGAEVIGETTLSIIAHALDPVVQLLVAISLPIASVVMIGGCFFFMFGNSEKAWSTIQNAGLGYILIQLSPLFLRVLKEIGNAI